MQFTTALVVLFAAMGVTATPVEPRVDATLVEPSVDGQVGTMEIRKGTCVQRTQMCKFKIDGKDNIAKCPSTPANYRCTATGTCDFDLVTRKVVRCY